ncbi:hypothetical protein ASPCADRAFT_409626 [Aspergillus carbonarius ITEM 5010]|uniref:non-specific serine/threonine protein kinase n=1 Tax=Aspergillus carbonarius (strain ITEM 5010) TaxID=602072 RepID=A0A1R3R8V5_ASPC5|nr:hypothetical protein ASPCADRAFT_409626 [Aspergillus carbonarius ITEM 5010]
MRLTTSLLRLLRVQSRRIYMFQSFSRYNHKIANNGAAHPLEEQTLPFYHQKHYYPARIGEILNDRYRIISKLGYEAYSTVWLGWDDRLKQYATLKICIRDHHPDSPVANEVAMLKCLRRHAQEADHPGLGFTRLAQDTFQIDTLTGSHHCIVTKLQGASIRTLQEVLPNAKLPKLLVKSLIHRLFVSVNWLHATCGLIHTDDTIFKEVGEQEFQDPSTPIVSQGVLIYRSRATTLELSGIPILTDFGQMRPSEPANRDWWMSDLYRAPETLELLEGKNLFDPIDRTNNQYVLPLALAQYIGYLGSPPVEIIQQSRCFRRNRASDPPIPQVCLEAFVTSIPPGKEKEAFLRFIRKILTWDPEVRATSVEIIPDEWLTKPWGGEF